MSLDERQIERSTGFVASAGEQLYYETAGDPRGETLVFCHGLGGNHTSWFQQVPEFAADYFLVTWDQRGFGNSTNQLGESGPATASQDLGRLLDHLERPRANLVGQSMGGWTVLGFAIEQPTRVTSLTLSGSIAGVFTPEIEAEFDRVLREVADREDAAGTPPLGMHPALGKKFTATNPSHAFLYQQLSSLSPAPPRDMPLRLRAGRFALGAVHELDVPVMLIHGRHDPIFSPKIIGEVAKQLSNARVVEIEGSGHSPYFETPEQWNAALRTFLNQKAT